MRPCLTYRASLEHIALVTRGECTAEMHGMSPTKGHSSKIGRCNQPTKHIGLKMQIRQNGETEEYVQNKGAR